MFVFRCRRLGSDMAVLASLVGNLIHWLPYLVYMILPIQLLSNFDKWI